MDSPRLVNLDDFIVLYACEFTTAYSSGPIDRRKKETAQLIENSF